MWPDSVLYEQILRLSATEVNVRSHRRISSWLFCSARIYRFLLPLVGRILTQLKRQSRLVEFLIMVES